MRRMLFGVVIVLSVTSTQSVTSAADGKDIVDTAVAAGSFDTLVAAVKAAGLVDALKGEGPFTVFAPSDEAFAKLPQGTVEGLLAPEKKQALIAILTYHVVKGEVPASKVVALSGAVTLNGQRADIKIDGSDVMVDQAKVVKADIACSNGIIHVIDSVMLPAADDIPTTARNAGTFSTLLSCGESRRIGRGARAERVRSRSSPRRTTLSRSFQPERLNLC